MTLSRRRSRPAHRGAERSRRDPRAERTGDVPGAVAAESAQAAPRARRDPRAVRASAAVVGGRLRIDRARPLHLVGAGQVRTEGASANTGARVVRIPEPVCWVLAVPEQTGGRLTAHDRDALGAARRLADAQGGAVVALVAAASAELSAAGADRVMHLPQVRDGEYAPEERAAAVLAAVRALDARHLVLPDVPHGGGDLGRRVAAALGEMPAASVVALDAGSLTSRGDGGRSDYRRAPPRVVLVAPEAAEPVSGARHEALPLDAPPYRRVDARVEDLGLVDIDPASVALAEAGLILSAGAGVTDWESFHALAAALGATEGASRVVCDAGTLPHDRQVGASGTLVAARGYIALGISGAPQHLEGIKRCEYVIAVNTDPHAEIVKRADLAVIGDVQLIMPALLRELEGRSA